jgi:uncharacterized membrane protein YfcA
MWFEVAIVSTLVALGHIFFGHFEEKTPRWRLVLKLAIAIALGASISFLLGRIAFWVLLILMALPVVYIHGWWLPSKGINGWTGEPKEKYYALRGWSLPPVGPASRQAPSADDGGSTRP